jgi:uncharacterized protein YndB with AHSA1/START domain
MSIEFATELRIGASPERVFAAMGDMDEWPRWMQGLVRVEKLTAGPFGVGTAWRETRKMFGREASEHFEVTSFEPAGRLALRVDGSKGSSGQGEYRFDYRLVPDGAGTRLRMTAVVDMPGWFARVLGRVFAGAFRKACEKDLSAMKAYLEGVG